MLILGVAHSCGMYAPWAESLQFAMTELRTDTSGRVKKAKVCCTMVILLILKAQLVDSLTWKDLLFLPTLIARHDVHGRLSLMTSFALTGYSDHSDHVARFRQIANLAEKQHSGSVCGKMQRFSLQHQNVQRTRVLNQFHWRPTNLWIINDLNDFHIHYLYDVSMLCGHRMTMQLFCSGGFTLSYMSIMPFNAAWMQRSFL